MRRTRWPRGRQRGPRPARSCAAENQSNDIARGDTVRVEAFDAVHQRAHQKQPPAVLALDVVGTRRVPDVAVQVERLTLVLHVDDELPGVDFGAHEDALLWILVV